MSSINLLGTLSGSIGSSGSSSSSTTSGTGLGQGINVQQFVQFAVANQQAAITALQTQQTSLTAQSTELGTINKDLAALSDAAFALRDPLGALAAQTATSSNSAVVSANAASTATPGSHSIVVTNLATTSSYYTSPLLTSSSTISAGTFQVAIGSKPAATVTVDSTNNTLSALATSINDQNIGVTASIIQDANGYRLALVSTASGLPGDVTVSGNTTGLSFTKAVTGVNAILTVDGVPINSSSNTVANVINGVTLNLASAPPDSAAVTVNVNSDAPQATTAINNFVTAYNTLITEVNKQFAVSSTGGTNPLEGDNTLRDAQSSILAAVSYSVSGNSGMVNLASIGVNMNNDGTLTVDSGALSSALSNNFSAVRNLLQNPTTGFSQNFGKAISSLNSSTGTLTIDSQSIGTMSRSLNQQIIDLQAAMTVQEAHFTDVYSKVNITLQQLPMLQNQLSQQLASIG